MFTILDDVDFRRDTILEKIYTFAEKCVQFLKSSIVSGVNFNWQLVHVKLAACLFEHKT